MLSVNNPFISEDVDSLVIWVLFNCHQAHHWHESELCDSHTPPVSLGSSAAKYAVNHDYSVYIMRPYRITRLVELTSITEPLIINRATQRADPEHHNVEQQQPWPILVGQFITRKQAAILFPEDDLPDGLLGAASPSVCFVDGTGYINCEFAQDFDVNWLSDDTYSCYLLEWALIPYKSKPGSTKWYLEVCSLPRFFDKTYALSRVSSYDFDHIDLLVDCQANIIEPHPSSPHAQLSDNELIERYKPVNMNFSHIDAKAMTKELEKIRRLEQLSIHGMIQSKGFIQNRAKEGKIRKFFVVEVVCKQEKTEEFGDAVLTACVCYEDAAQATKLDIIHYYHHLKVGKWYLLSNLTASKIKIPVKGGSIIRKVLNFDINNSKLFNVKPPVIIPDTVAVDTNTIDGTPQPNTIRSQPIQIPMHPKVQPKPGMISYSGRISKIVNVHNGLYELDGKLHLVLSYHQIAGPGFGLRLGAGVNLHNVHLAVLNTGDRVRPGAHPVALIACPYSTLEIAEFSSEANEFQSIDVFKRNNYLIKHQKLNAVDLLLITIIRIEVIRKLQVKEADTIVPVVETKWPTKLFTDLLSRYGYTHYEKDTPIAVSFEHQDLCSIAKVRYRQPCFPPLKELFNHPVITDFRNQSTKSSGTRPSSSIASARKHRHMIVSKSSIRYRVFSQEELNWTSASLLGVLVANARGEVVLKDTTHSIQCLVSSNDITPHDLNQIWVIDRYQIIMEVLGSGFLRSTEKQQESLSEVPFENLVIRFSLRDAMCLGAPHLGILSAAPQIAVVSRARERHNYFAIIDVVRPIQQVLTGESRIDTQCWVEAVAVEFKQLESGITELYGAEKSVLILFTGPSIANIVGLRRGEAYSFTELAELQPKEDHLQEDDEDERKDGASIDTDDDAESTAPPPALMNDDDPCLAFDGKSKLSSFSVVTCSDEDISAATLSPLPLPEPCKPIVYRVSGTNAEMLSDLKPPCETIHTVSRILQDISIYRKRPQFAGIIDTLINVKGVVVTKEYRDVEPLVIPGCTATELYVQHGIGTGDYGRTLFVKIRDLEEGDTMDVYLDLRRCVVPLGLIPNTIITIRQLGLKISKSNNIYGASIATTSISIGDVATSLPTRKIIERSNLRVRLSDFFSQDSNSKLTALISRNISALPGIRCNVTHIQLVTLRYKCTGCGASYLESKCPNGHGSGTGMLISYARIFIEDGSAEAVVHIDDTETVFALLSCRDNTNSSNKRHKLERMAMRYGDVTFKFDPPWFANTTSNDDWGEANNNSNNSAEQDEDTVTLGSETHETFAMKAEWGDKVKKDAEYIETICKSPSLKRTVIAYCRAQSSFTAFLASESRDSGGGNQDDGIVVSRESLGRRMMKLESGARLSTLTYPRIVLRGESFEEVAERSEAHFLLEKLNHV
ncbi:hypothetical protein SmJEL517_g00207 [Synchytrium microbalum]|uniref:CST complex subunit CTC1 n=1 Tax=Synchytrium microbalum TaxID=1806994 RepID=A0A507C9D1_9FUNG|nr:uncharacterized protein SmJEL517_g00207 [Synchytrium microbalum]TPX38190.1 hypothetical protein SmJEL517_g00207 [Synchytrium microbalum]